MDSRNSDDDYPYNDWDAAIPRILDLIRQLEAANIDFGALVWEYEWDMRDMLEEIQGLRQLLRQGITESSLASSHVKKSLEAGPREIISDLEAALRAERSKNWELSYYARDVEEDKWKLQMKLRDSIPAGGDRNPLSKAKTALEITLEAEIAELREAIRNPKGGRGRAKSV
ncbi:hypothetical protein OQA88_2145 [Cercophora sp. LCS_1]